MPPGDSADSNRERRHSGGPHPWTLRSGVEGGAEPGAHETENHNHRPPTDGATGNSGRSNSRAPEGERSGGSHVRRGPSHERHHESKGEPTPVITVAEGGGCASR